LRRRRREHPGADCDGQKRHARERRARADGACQRAAHQGAGRRRRRPDDVHQADRRAAADPGHPRAGLGQRVRDRRERRVERGAQEEKDRNPGGREREDGDEEDDAEPERAQACGGNVHRAGAEARYRRAGDDPHPRARREDDADLPGPITFSR
jgi:hypothetical protein